jgi:ABC-type multidrug transport system fused ATPase/permease subunit
MRDLPVPDPGTPDHRSATRYLWWLARLQRRTVLYGMSMGIVWMVSQALMPAVIGSAIDSGVTRRDTTALLGWTGLLLGLGVLQATAGVLRHRCAVSNWLQSCYRTIQVVVRHATHLGATLPRRVATGEVVSVGTNDVEQIGGTLDTSARAMGAVVAIVTVTVILLTSSMPLGLVVVLGVPVLAAVVAVLLKPLHRRQHAYRTETGKLTSRASDIVVGLRVLRGIGGEAAFSARYRDESQRVRAAGVRVARVDSLLDAAQILLPGLFVAMVTWLGARFAVEGAITVGQLIAFYGYAVFLLFPLRTLIEFADKLTRGHVAAGRVVRVLALAPELAEPAAEAPVPDPLRVNLTDPDSAVVVRPGRFTAIAAARPEDATAIADRLGRYTDSEARLDGVLLSNLDRATVRELVMVADNEARLFSGRLRDELTGARLAANVRVIEALRAASATDIVEALPDGLDSLVTERGREFSGGQQQRLRLARALVADPPVLILVEPTSAVDAHTEARVASRLVEVRSGRTTVVCTTSPLVLDRADEVLFVEAGRVVAQGTHRELLSTSPAYAATVTRGEDDE